MYRLLPLRTISRVWGFVNSIELPIVLRKPILNTYIETFGCNLSEASIEDLTQYKNLSEFFRRSLKPGVRPIDPTNGIVSPVDGTVLHFGKANNGKVEQVKGITYSLSAFLGPQTFKCNKKEIDANVPSLKEYQKNLFINNSKKIKTELYSCVIYLSPGDYHRFHSPANWTVNFRRHFAGQLFSVKPTFVNGFPNLFSLNERVIYTGQWDYGFFSMIAVGATNVGTVRVYFDDVSYHLMTNFTKIFF
jgi:phosphatidylserine decarboxylase